MSLYQISPHPHVGGGEVKVFFADKPNFLHKLGFNIDNRA